MGDVCDIVYLSLRHDLEQVYHVFLRVLPHIFCCAAGIYKRNLFGFAPPKKCIVYTHWSRIFPDVAFEFSSGRMSFYDLKCFIFFIVSRIKIQISFKKRLWSIVICLYKIRLKVKTIVVI